MKDDRRFDGDTYDEDRDGDRLETALDRVYRTMSDGAWHTIKGLAILSGSSEAGASARIRDLRKEKIRERGYPNRGVESKRIKGGLWAYRMIPA